MALLTYNYNTLDMTHSMEYCEMKSLTLAQIIYIQIILQFIFRLFCKKTLQGETVSPLIIKDSNRG